MQTKKFLMSGRRFDPVLYVGLAGAVLVLSACNTVPATQTPDTAVYVHHIYRPAPQPPAPLSPLDDPNSVLARRSVYFGVNAAEVREADRSLLRAHAEFMRANPVPGCGLRVTPTTVAVLIRIVCWRKGGLTTCASSCSRRVWRRWRLRPSATARTTQSIPQPLKKPGPVTGVPS